MSGDGRDAQLTGPIDYWQIANIIALAIDLYEDAELNNILAYDFTFTRRYYTIKVFKRNKLVDSRRS